MPRPSFITTRKLTVGIAAAMLVLSACSSDAAADKVKFALPTGMGANNAPLAVAHALGYFEDEGFEVEIVSTGDSASIVQGIDSGSLDIGSTPPEPIFQAMTKGTELELAYNYIRQQTGSIAVLADGPIERLEDLESGTIGQSNLGVSNVQLSEGILATGGLTADEDYSHLAVGTGASALQALESGAVDALSLWDTEYAAFEASGTALRYFTTDEVEQLFSTTIFVSDEYLEKNADVVGGFGRALAKGTVFAATNPEAALRIMYDAFPETVIAGTDLESQLEIDTIALERRIELLIAGDPQGAKSWGAYTDASLAAWVDFASSVDILDGPLDPTTLASNSLVAEYSDFDADEIAEHARNWSHDE